MSKDADIVFVIMAVIWLVSTCQNNRKYDRMETELQSTINTQDGIIDDMQMRIDELESSMDNAKMYIDEVRTTLEDASHIDSYAKEDADYNLDNAERELDY